MDVARLTEGGRFLEQAGRVLFDDRARHNLILGVTQTAVDQPDIYSDFVGWVASDRGSPLAAAARTPPRHLILADARSPRGLHALANRIARDDAALPGVVGNQPTVRYFAQLWAGLVRCTVEVEMDQGVFMLEEVLDPPPPGGWARAARPADVDLLVRWLRAFTTEAIPGEGMDEAHAGEVVGLALDPRRPQGVWLWEDGIPVSMAAHSPPSFRGVRIGPVYTPPEFRGKGYATALVAGLSRRLLAEGNDFCYLYTDLANQTSNSIYQRIGYREVAKSAQVGFRSGRR